MSTHTMSEANATVPASPPSPAPAPDLATLPAGGPPGTDRGRLGSVFWTSVGISTLFVAWAVLFTDNAAYAEARQRLMLAKPPGLCFGGCGLIASLANGSTTRMPDFGHHVVAPNRVRRQTRH